MDFVDLEAGLADLAEDHAGVPNPGVYVDTCEDAYQAVLRPLGQAPQQPVCTAAEEGEDDVVALSRLREQERDGVE